MGSIPTGSTIPLHHDLRPRCYSWPDGIRCQHLAVGVLYAPSGEPNPGGAICEQCAAAVIEEYAMKLGEAWTLRRYEWAAAEMPAGGER